MTNKEAYEIMLEAKLYMTLVTERDTILDIKKMKEAVEAVDHALVALAYFVNMDQLSDEISDKCQKALGEKWIAERKEE